VVPTTDGEHNAPSREGGKERSKMTQRRNTVAGEIGGYERGRSGRVNGAYNGVLVGGAAGQEACTEVLVQASPNNTGVVGLGFGVSGNTPIELAANAAVTLPVRRLNLLRINIAAGDYVNWMSFIAA
jgi:hypothetical protein